MKALVTLVMVWEFPAVSQTRIDFWKKPQFTQSGMWWFTLIFGFFGLHHLLLRSPQTALLFLMANMVSFGYFWAYDLIQLSSGGGIDTEELNKHGLSHAFGALGLGQGMWIPPSSSSSPSASPSQNDDDPPNPYLFFLYALMIPIAPLAQIIAGDTNNAISRFLDLTFVPLGFLFYFASIVYDYIILFLYPGDLLLFGSKRFFPFTYLGMDLDSHSKRLTGQDEVEYKKPCPSDNILVTLIKIFLPFAKQIPGVAIVAAQIEAAIATAKATKEVVIDGGMQKVQQATQVATQVGRLATEIPGAVTAPLLKVSQIAANPLALIPPPPPLPLPPQPLPQQQQPPLLQKQSLLPQQKPIASKRIGTMVGGAMTSLAEAKTYNPLEYLTLGTVATVIGGGLLLGINRTLNRYSVSGKDDSPPDAGRV